MFHIGDNGIITITRGDAFALDVFVNIGTVYAPVQYVLEPGDKLCFGLMEPHQPFEVALIRKVFTEEDVDEETGLVHMYFAPEMTEFLVPGTYYYCVKLAAADGDVSTVISKTKFIILD